MFLVLQLPGGFKLPTSMSWAPCVCHAPADSAHIPEGCRGQLPMGAEPSAPSSPGGEEYMAACAPTMCPLGSCASTA